MLHGTRNDASFRPKRCSFYPPGDASFVQKGASFPMPRGIFSGAMEHRFEEVSVAVAIGTEVSGYETEITGAEECNHFLRPLYDYNIRLL